MKPIFTVRPFTPAGWPLYKQMRLKSLLVDQNVFSIRHDVEAGYSDAAWQEELANPDFGIFGVYAGDELIGMTGILVDVKKDPSRQTAKLWGSWLEKEWRGKGASVPMYEARIDWARRHPTIRRITVSHRESNTASKAANQKHGFVYTHTADFNWPDGTRAPEVFYELMVKP